jgi:hypothetical protein
VTLVEAGVWGVEEVSFFGFLATVRGDWFSAFRFLAETEIMQGYLLHIIFYRIIVTIRSRNYRQNCCCWHVLFVGQKAISTANLPYQEPSVNILQF